MELNKDELQLIFTVLDKEIGSFAKAKMVLDLAAKIKIENDRLLEQDNKQADK